MKKTRTPRAARRRRHVRVRKTVSGSPQRPRLAVFRSIKHVYAQIIDDTAGHTLVSATDLESGFPFRTDAPDIRHEIAMLGPM